MTLTIQQAIEDQARGVAKAKAQDPETQHLSYRPFIEPDGRISDDLIHLAYQFRYTRSHQGHRVHRRNAKHVESCGFYLTDLPAEPGYAAPTRVWDPEAVDAAVAQQYKAFGAVRSTGQIKASHTSYKYAKKQAALQGTLNAAFATRNAYASETVELGEQGYEDTSVEDADTTTTTLQAIYAQLNERQIQVAELLIDGKTQKEIGIILGIAQQGVSQVVGQIKAKLSR